MAVSPADRAPDSTYGAAAFPAASAPLPTAGTILVTAGITVLSMARVARAMLVRTLQK